MICNELRELEGARRRALWALASLSPGDPKASELLETLDELDNLDLNATSFTQKPLELIEVRESVPAERHHSGIDIILERTIPQPWRGRFNQLLQVMRLPAWYLPMRLRLTLMASFCLLLAAIVETLHS